MREAHALVRDLMEPRPWIYWLDFSFHQLLGWSAFATAWFAPRFSALQLGALLVAAFAIYRAVIFVHELAHLRPGTFVLFRWVWNLTCGIPMLAPSFLYDGVHNDHHKRDLYGTHDDGEYLPFVRHGRTLLLTYPLLSFLLPLVFVARFLVLAPLSWFLPAVRRFTWERASSLAIDLAYKRPADAIRSDRLWRLQEVLTFAYAATMFALMVRGAVPAGLFVLWYAMTTFIFFLNSLRTMAAHAYRNTPDQHLDLTAQYLDSVDVPGHPFFTALWAPVGLRYHATHHLFMSMPYHNLGQARRRLEAGLADNSLYMQAKRKSLWDALARIWREAGSDPRPTAVRP